MKTAKCDKNKPFGVNVGYGQTIKITWGGIFQSS